MMPKTRLVYRALPLIILLFVVLIAPAWAQTNGEYPIAAITSGNVWLYDLNGRGLKVSEGRGFHNLLWSPDGTVLAFVGPSTGDNPTSIYITDSTGRPPIELIMGYLDFPVSFAPDGSLVYGLTVIPDPTPDDLIQKIDVYSVRPQAGAIPDYQGSFEYAAGCGGGAGYDPAQINYMRETNAMRYVRTILAATPWGIVHNAACSPEEISSLLNGDSNVTYGAFMPQDRSQMFTTRMNGFARIADGKISTEYVTAVQPDRLGFAPPGSSDLFYSTRALVEPITLPDNIVSALQANNFQPHLERYTVTLHRFNFSTGIETQIYTAEAYGIGNIYGLADGTGVVFSQVPNPDDWATALIDGTISLQDIAGGNYKTDDYSKVELYQLGFSTGKVRRVGSDMNTFVLNTVNPSGAVQQIFTPLPTVIAPSATPPTFTINEQVIVNPDVQALNVRATPDTNAPVVEILPGGTLVTITDGPTEAGGYTWWRVLLPSTAVGWVVERIGDSQTLQLP
ncbi:MAG: SH3 domain-containing protein [Chloroflexota bacterium]